MIIFCHSIILMIIVQFYLRINNFNIISHIKRIMYIACTNIDKGNSNT